MTTDYKPLDFYREKIEANPGKVVLRHRDGVKFRPFYNTGDWWHGLDDNEVASRWTRDHEVWTEVRPVVVRWLWSYEPSDFHQVSFRFYTEEEAKAQCPNRSLNKLEWSRTEFTE